MTPPLAAALLLALAGTVLAGPAVRVFDFEERDDGNFEELPMHFARVAGPGMPHWVRGRISPDAARGGDYSFKLELDGGSLLYRLNGGVLPAAPGASYRVGGFVKSTPLRHARPRLAAYLADRDGNPIAGTRRFAEPDRVGGTDWEPVGVTVASDDPAVAWIVIELGLLQPAAADGPEVARVDRLRQDVRGAAWFDDVSVARVPTLTLTGGPAGGLYEEGRPVTFEASANDPLPGDLVASCVVRDERGVQVWRGPAKLTEGEAGGVRLFAVDAGPLPPGWYEAAVTAGPPTQAAGSPGTTTATTSFVVLADAPATYPDPRFAADASGLPPSAWPAVADAVGPLGVGRVSLDVWHDDGQLTDVGQRLKASGVAVTGVLGTPPAELARLVGGGSWADLAPLIVGRNPDDVARWRPGLADLVTRHAGEVDFWQIGGGGDADLVASDPAVRAAARVVRQLLGELVPAGAVAVPWPARRDAGDLAALGARAVSLGLPADVPPEAVASHAADFAVPARLNLRAVDAADYGNRAATADLAKRFVYALSAPAAAGVTLPLPFDDNGRPTPLYPAARTLLTRLAGLTYAGPIASADSRVTAHLFAGPAGEGVVIAWSPPVAGAWGGFAEATLIADVIADARQVDLDGVARAVESDAAAGRARVRVGPTPTLLTGVDVAATRLRQSVRLDEPGIESSFEPHNRRLLMANDSPRPLAGTLTIRPPIGWEVEPRRLRFALSPGERSAVPLVLRTPYNADAGRHVLDVEIALDDGRRLAVPVEAQIGLRDVGLQTSWRREGADLVVEQRVTNYGDRPLDFAGFVLLPGLARQERLLTDLPPGGTVRRSYRFPAAADLPAGTPVRSGLRELEGTRILNDRVKL